MKGDYLNSIALLNNAKHFCNDEILNISLGDNFKNLKQYGKAEEAYLQASVLAPYKLYPLYALATMYYENKQLLKAYNIAKIILKKEIKVKSEATNEILKRIENIVERKR